MKKLRIAIFEPSRIFPGGGQKEMANTACYLSKKHDVTIFTQRLAQKDLDFGNSKFKFIKPHNRYLAAFAFLNKKISNTKFDIMITGGFPANLATLGNNLPSLHISHAPPRFFYDLKEHMLKNSGLLGKLNVYTKNVLFKKLDYKAVQKNTVILGISREIKNRIKNFYGRDSYIFYPGVDPKKYKTGKYENYILSVCRMVTPKRPEMIVEAMKLIKNKDINMIFAGSGPVEGKIKETAKNMKNVKVLGYVPDDKLKELYANCLAAIYIPINEDYGYAPVEAAMAGKTTIGVDEGGLKDTIIDGKTGFLIKDVNAKKVAEKIDLLANNKSLAKKMGMNAKKYCTKFELKNTFDVLDKAIVKAIEVFNKGKKNN